MYLHVTPRQIALILVLLLAGCGSGPRTVRVTGTATYQGKSAPANLVITFLPQNGQRSIGLTDQNGKFILRSSSGKESVPVGMHKVCVQLKPAASRQDDEEYRAAQLNDPTIAAILEKYGNPDTTPLVVEIKDGRDITVALD